MRTGPMPSVRDREGPAIATLVRTSGCLTDRCPRNDRFWGGISTAGSSALVLSTVSLMALIENAQLRSAKVLTR